jgi:hypothetical protein
MKIRVEGCAKLLGQLTRLSKMIEETGLVKQMISLFAGV